MHIKYKGKGINPRLQRWILKLGKYDINIEYIKGKDNIFADFLSRLNVDTGEIHTIEESQQDEDNMSTRATIHSQVEETNDHFPILETVVNHSYTHLILTQNKKNRHH